jgi:hypothetical protein
MKNPWWLVTMSRVGVIADGSRKHPADKACTDRDVWQSAMRALFSLQGLYHKVRLVVSKADAIAIYIKQYQN